MALDITSIGAALASLKTGLDLINGARQLARDSGNIEVAEKLLAAYDALLDARNQMSDLRDEIDRQRAEITQLREQLAFKEELVFDSGEQLYRRKNGPDGDMSRWCPVCVDKPGGEPSRLVPQSKDTGFTGVDDAWHVWLCTRCGSYFRRFQPDSNPHSQ